MTQWKPIDSAPKDGSVVWVKLHNGEELRTRWIEPTPATAGWFPWYYTARLNATHWKPGDPQ